MPLWYKDLNIMTTTRLWELSNEIQQLENAIASIAEDETLSEEEREIKLQETFNQWLSTGESFKVKAEQVARYIRHQEALAEARKTEAKRIRELATQAENQANRLRKYLTNQMLMSNINRIDGISTKIGLRKKQPTVLLNFLCARPNVIYKNYIWPPIGRSPLG